MLQYNIFTSVGEINIVFDDERTDKPVLFIHGPKMIISQVVAGIGEEDEIMAWVTEKDLKTIPVMFYTILEVIKIASEYSAFTFLNTVETKSSEEFETITLKTTSLQDTLKKLENELQDYGVETFDSFIEPAMEKRGDHHVISFRITEDGVWYPESEILIYADKIEAILCERYEGGDMWHYIENKSTTMKNLQKELFIS